jgi:F-type H+-transporting ATPase subunit delta
VAKGDNELDRWSRMLSFLSAAGADPHMKLLLEAPEVGEEQKAFRLIEVCGDELNDRARKFVQVLAANKRLPLIGEIAEVFEELRALEQRSLEVEVLSAFPLSEAESERLKDALGRKFDKAVQLESRVDESLIGGVLIRAGDVVIDGSVRGKLGKLKETIQRA